MSGMEKRLSALKPIYHPRRALEHMQTVQGIKPVRVFAILFPLWDVETTAVQEEKRPYELLERYVERGMDEGQLHTVEELTSFFGLQREMVEKILLFLETIGHVKHSGMYWELTPLGYKSVREQEKYVEQEKHVRFYFDAYTSKPLRKEHYDGRKVHIFSLDEAEEVLHTKTWGYRFHLVSSMREWQPLALRELEARVDRADYNVPPEMQGIQVVQNDAHAVQLAYIPMYIIETTRQVSGSVSAQGYSGQKPYYLVYTGIRDLRDSYFETIINSNNTVYAALRGEKVWSQQDLWRDWLQDHKITNALPLERPDGTWQISLPVSAFAGSSAKFPTTRVGEYELSKGYVLQIWCDDRVVRRKAVLDRTLQLVKNQQRYIKKQTVQEQLLLLTKQLQTDPVSFNDLRQRALDTKMDTIVKVLDSLQR
jgi:hypothetical protein